MVVASCPTHKYPISGGLMVVGFGRVLGLVAARALALPRVLPRFERFLRDVRLYRSLCSVRCVPVLARVWV